MKTKKIDEFHSSNPLSIYLKKLAKKNKESSLMESQNLEANKLGFKNWHFFLKHIKNKFNQSFPNHPFNPTNKNNGLNSLLQPYVFNLGFNLDYGIDFYANKSQLRNRFTSLHSKNFNQKYIKLVS